MIHVWTEDKNAGYVFWQKMNQLYFQNELSIESFQSNQGILDAAKDFIPNAEDIYYIAFDKSLDNRDIYLKYELLKTYISDHDNMILLDLVCFEELILRFSELLIWTGTNRKDKIHMRKVILENLEPHAGRLKNDIEDGILMDFISRMKRFSAEKLIKAVVRELTDNDMWRIDAKNKTVAGEEHTSVGKCWTEDCCVLDRVLWNKRKCGCNREYTGKEKMHIFVSDLDKQGMFKNMVSRYVGEVSR